MATQPEKLAGSPANPRAERTRQQIFAAVATLMAEPSSKASVTDIVRVAGISRSSFYAHFSSLDEVAADILRAQFADIGATGLELRDEDFLTGRNAARIGYQRLVAHLVQHIPFYANVLALPMTREIYDSMVRGYTRRVLETATTLGAVPLGVEAEMAATYTAAGTLGLITAWMRSDFEASDADIVEELVSLLPGWLVDAGP